MNTGGVVSYRDFVAKHARVAMTIAQDLLRARPGDRLPPVGEYARRLGVGRGTVQTALNLLKEHGAVSLVARGHMGTFIASVDPAALWELTGLGTITGVMPLPYSMRYKGLATGLYRAFQEAAIPLVMAHMRGARRRLAALDSRRYEFAVVSRYSYEVAREEMDYLELAVALGPKTSVREHVLIVREAALDDAVPDRACGRRLADGLRVGIDPDSIDVTDLTLRECRGVEVELVELPYVQFLEQIRKGTIDAAVWDSEEGLPEEGSGFKVVPLRGSEAGELPETGEAVLVVHRDNRVVKSILSEKIDPAVVRETQARVLRGEELPEL
ncbi:MAG TPA: hypothetical protein DHW14_03850 [Clostridiales bacterium]|nr:hypothetical protein [Clostridiales bacterium]